MPQPPHRYVKRPAHQLRRVLPRQQRADDAARRGKARPQAREGRIGTVRKQDKRCEQTGCVRPCWASSPPRCAVSSAPGPSTAGSAAASVPTGQSVTMKVSPARAALRTPNTARNRASAPSSAPGQRSSAVSTGTSKPARCTQRAISPRPTAASSYVRRAQPAVSLTNTACTPGSPRSAHTMRTAQAPQSMPEMRRITSVIFAAAFRDLPTGQQKR